MKHEEREKEMREIHVEGESRGEVTVYFGGGGIPRFLPLVLPLGVERS